MLFVHSSPSITVSSSLFSSIMVLQYSIHLSRFTAFKWSALTRFITFLDRVFYYTCPTQFILLLFIAAVATSFSPGISLRSRFILLSNVFWCLSLPRRFDVYNSFHSNITRFRSSASFADHTMIAISYSNVQRTHATFICFVITFFYQTSIGCINK